METKAKHCKNHRNTFYSEHKGSSSTDYSQAGWLNTAVQPYPDLPWGEIGQTTHLQTVHRGTAWQSGWFWGAHTSTLRTGALALVYSAAEYAAPAWCRSTHVKKNLDVTLNDTMRIVNGCLRPTPVKYLLVLSGIAPPALRREYHTSMLVNKALLDNSHLLHARIATAQNLAANAYIRSRRPFSRQAASLANSNFNLMEQWKHDWQETIKPAQLTILPGTNIPPGADLPRRELVTLNRLRTGVGRFGANMYRWGLRPSAGLPVRRP